ncbi:glycosyl hydrolase family 8 [Pseudochelatococcus contaminans]|uniref:cellulase n=1 Tax=Pseudochelatococcus contaminans TaxID=1538103 RepID=A0A7W6EHA0_9HYPH|nr:glycosyl hydrolase family 8 [Pseudochelatococcus contaminans]MBB3809632.1 endoglucanase [Pseudochelatococcus contaminans]
MMRYSFSTGSKQTRAAIALAIAFAAALLCFMTISSSAAVAQPAARIQSGANALISPDEWQQYRSRFITSGRVVDDANGNISHSESQGYGMLLAVLANDPATFDALWSFVRTDLLIRDDGLVAWRWDPKSQPHVTDVNNASDGDILIAYALLLGADKWGRPELAASARKIISALAQHSVSQIGGQPMLMPGVEGFGPGTRNDAPVVNPSYWIFEALPLFSKVDNGKDVWNQLTKSGLDLIDESRFGPAGIPPEWVSLRDPARPMLADGFPEEYGYNALRIPLYLLRAGIDDRKRLERFRAMWTRNGRPAAGIIDVATGRSTHMLKDPGYEIIAAALSCALDGTPIPDNLKQFSPTLYYPSTLHLLGLSLVRERYPQCL